MTHSPSEAVRNHPLREQTFSYFVVCIDYPRRVNADGVVYPASREAVVDPEITRREVVSRIRSGEYKDISFIHHITMNDVPQDVTDELMAEAQIPVALDFTPLSPADRQANAFDHARALRNETV